MATLHRCNLFKHNSCPLKTFYYYYYYYDLKIISDDIAKQINKTEVAHFMENKNHKNGGAISMDKQYRKTKSMTRRPIPSAKLFSVLAVLLACSACARFPVRLA